MFQPSFIRIPDVQQPMATETMANMHLSMDPEADLKAVAGFGDPNWINEIHQPRVGFGKPHNSTAPLIRRQVNLYLFRFFPEEK